MIQKCRVLFLLLVPVAFFFSCQSYTNKNADMRNEMYAGNIEKATKTLDASDIATEDRNFALFRMEKGMLLYLAKQYDSAAQLWLQADKRLDDLYTTSISRTAASFVINDSMSDYNGEAHERLLLPIFSSMAFFANNNINNAQVMARRAYDVTNALQNENEGKNTFKYDAFSHYFAALVYEAKNDWDNALVEYRLSLSNLSQNSTANEKSASKNEILKAMGRLAQYRNRNDILHQIKKEAPNLVWMDQETLLKKGEVYIVYESGKVPIKVPEEIIIPTGKTVAKISFPKYKEVPYSSHYADIYVAQKHVQRTTVMESVGKMAEQALSDRRVRDIAKMAARVIAKDVAARKLTDENPFAGLAVDIFNVATEVADTRSWTTLPDTIQIARVPVEARKETEVVIKPQHGEEQKFSVTLNPGEKKLYRFRTFN
ncbi:MAG: hypothetical protein V4591_08915 [Bdellovibrionota bacterium]